MKWKKISPACARATTRSGIAGFDAHALDGYALMAWSLRFHGVGNASAVELGSPMATIERDGAPWLTIDSGAAGRTASLPPYELGRAAGRASVVRSVKISGCDGTLTKK